MIEWITTTYLGKVLSTFVISMLPVFELRAGIPWGIAHGLPLWQAFIISVLGNMLPIPFILLFLRKVFKWLKTVRRIGPLIEKLERRAHLKGQKVEKYKALGLFILVAIPLPGTGAWTGALVASVLEIPIKKALPLIFAGVVVAGIAMLIISHGFTVIF